MISYPPGIYENLPMETYRSIDAMNIHLLMKGRRSMAHLKYAIDHREEQDEPTAAKILGTAGHMAVLEPERFEALVIERPKFVGKGAVAARDAWEEQHLGRLVLTPAELAEVRAMAASVMSHPKASRIFGTPGKSELSIVWDDEDTGVRCKCRLDRLIPGVIAADLKSSRSAYPSDFERDAWNMGYCQQIAFYADGTRAATGLNEDFVVPVVENEPPYAVAVYHPSDEFLAVGRVEYRRLLRQYARCVQSGVWPGYDQNVQHLGLPLWVKPKADIVEEHASEPVASVNDHPF